MIEPVGLIVTGLYDAGRYGYEAYEPTGPTHDSYRESLSRPGTQPLAASTLRAMNILTRRPATRKRRVALAAAIATTVTLLIVLLAITQGWSSRSGGPSGLCRRRGAAASPGS